LHTHLWPSSLFSICLLIVHAKISSSPVPSFQCTFSFPAPSAVVVDDSSLFIVQVFFQGWGAWSAQGLCWFIPVVAGEIPWDMWHSPVCSVECLTGRLEPAVVAVGQCQHSSFLSLTCCGDAFHKLGV
jgi:hypothetical protein